MSKPTSRRIEQYHAGLVPPSGWLTIPGDSTVVARELAEKRP